MKNFSNEIVLDRASDLVTQIDAINGATLENEMKIDAAYHAYYQLPEEDRVNVTNLDTLLVLREELAKFYIVGNRQGNHMPWHKLRIGTYAYPDQLWNEECVKILAESGMDFIAGCDFDEGLMALLDKYGIGAFVNADSLGVHTELYRYIRFFAPDPVSNPVASYAPKHTSEDVRAAAADARERVVPHPSVWGIELADEPDCISFRHLGRDMAIMDEVIPELTSYLNINPNYGSSWMYATPSYEKYVQQMNEHCNIDYICFDHYMYQVANTRGRLARFINNLEIIQQASNAHNKEMWIAIQANQDEGDPLEINRLKFQTYLSMAYGCKLISYGCWSGADCWYDPDKQITDREGKPTQRYYDLQEIIADLDALGPVFMRYTPTKVCAIGDIYGVEDLDFEMGQLAKFTGDPNMFFDMTHKEFNAMNLGLGCYDFVYYAGDENSTDTSKIKVDKDFLANNDTTLGQNVFVNFAVVEENAAVLIGGFKKNVGEGSAVMLVNMTDCMFTGEDGKESRTIELPATVTFAITKPDSVVTMYVRGIPTTLTAVDGVYTVNLNTADAAFVTVD